MGSSRRGDGGRIVTRTGRRQTRLRLAALTAALLAPSAAHAAAAAPVAPLIPISHVVIVYQENHSFDEVLGGLCVRDARCTGASSGKISTGQTIPLHAAPDIPPEVIHRHGAQTTAVHGGKMDRFDLNRGCTASTGYACYEQYAPEQIPNLAALA